MYVNNWRPYGASLTEISLNAHASIKTRRVSRCDDSAHRTFIDGMHFILKRQ